MPKQNVDERTNPLVSVVLLKLKTKKKLEIGAFNCLEKVLTFIEVLVHCEIPKGAAKILRSIFFVFPKTRTAKRLRPNVRVVYGELDGNL